MLVCFVDVWVVLLLGLRVVLLSDLFITPALTLLYALSFVSSIMFIREIAGEMKSE